MSLLETKQLQKIYGKFTDHPFVALKPIDLSIEEGEFVCIMGPSGAGKSTLLNILGTIDMPTEGKFFIDGKEVRVYGEEEMGRYRNENMGFIFQEFNLLNPLTVYQNISVPLIVGKQSEEEIDKKVKKVAKLCDIESILDKYPDQISGGQKQRVAVCRGLVNDPKLIVADEPTGNLDSKNSAAILEVFRQMNKEGKSVVMVSHDTYIASYSTRCIFIKDGEIAQIIEKGNLTQEEYYERIVDATSDEASFYED